MSKGRCCICGELIKTISKSDDSKEVSHCMHIRNLEVCPSQFDMPITYSGLWICHTCFSTMQYNISLNAKEYNNGY